MQWPGWVCLRPCAAGPTAPAAARHRRLAQNGCLSAAEYGYACAVQESEPFPLLAPMQLLLLHPSQQTGRFLVKVRIDAGLCQGHGRCYDLAPGLFGDDEEGYGHVRSDGVVPAGAADDARRAALNCPEHAIVLIEGDTA
jgi:ferredoxin